MQCAQEVAVPSGLEGSGVRVFHAPTTVDQGILDACDRVMDPGEHARNALLHRADDRLRHRLARGLVRYALARVAPVAPERWRFSVQDRGRPIIAEPDAQRHIQFNLSHTEGFVLCVVAPSGSLGCDVENVERRSDIDRVAERVFSDGELSAYRGLAPTDRRERFFALWTLKEAYLKARGMGISLPLRGFGFDVASTGTPALRFERDLGDEPQGWRFARWAPTAVHRAAIAFRP